MEKQIINTKELMALFGISRTSVYNFMERGLPYFRVGAELRFETKECLEWFKKTTK